MNHYFGDLHNHCSISYGFGSLENALQAAQQHLDFCSITGHAMWPDMHARKKEVEFLVDFHQKGFQKLASHWETVVDTVNRYHRDGEFVTFQGYEMHSRTFGDVHFLTNADSMDLLQDAQSPMQVTDRLKPRDVICVPHHIAYTKGFRGIDWERFDSRISPIVEVFSKHGCGMSDHSPYPYLHTMGPRDSKNTVMAGLDRGCVFGFCASTDHHAGYPGSYGDGRIAVLAEHKTRQSIWQALKRRRTYAITGDRIRARFFVNEQLFGEFTPRADRYRVRAHVTACDFLDRITVYRGAVPLKRFDFDVPVLNRASAGRYKIRVEMGWGKNEAPYAWHGTVKIENGILLDVEPCFRGKSILAPKKGHIETQSVNQLDQKANLIDCQHASFTCQTFANVSNLHSQTNAVILEVKADSHTVLRLSINGLEKRFVLSDLVKGSASFHMDYFNTHAVLIHRAVPYAHYTFDVDFVDSFEGKDTYYRMDIRQNNGQMAWISPVFIK